MDLSSNTPSSPSPLISESDLHSLWEQALHYHSIQSFNDAEACCMTLLSHHPFWIKVLELLASIYLKRQKSEISLFLLERALHHGRPSPEEAIQLHCNLATIFITKKQWDQALNHARTALVLAPSSARAHYLIATALWRLHEETLTSDQKTLCFSHLREALLQKPDFAEAYNLRGVLELHSLSTAQEAFHSFQQALQFSPTHPPFLYNLALAALKLGEFQQAIQAANTAIMLTQGKSAAWQPLTSALFDQGDKEALHGWYQQWLALPESSFTDHCRFTIYFALFALLHNHWQECRTWLEKTHLLLPHLPPQKEGVWLHNFYHFLEALSASPPPPLPETTPSLPILYSLGESHALVPAYRTVQLQGTSYTLVPKFVMGCKLWHLIAPYANSHRKVFLQQLASLPLNSSMLLCVGEIDCRLEEGFVSYLLKHPLIQPDTYIENIISQFGSWMEEHRQKHQCTLYVQGVPAPSKSLLTTGAPENLWLKVVELTNFCLQKCAAHYQWHFIDVYGLSKDADGWSNGCWHLDAYHLKPNYLSACLSQSDC